ncbi:MAG: DinB family protein [Bacteroidota bacterium]
MRKSELDTTTYDPYYRGYIQTLKDVELIDALKEEKETFLRFMKNVPIEKLSYAYAEGKWTVAEVLMHIIDAERVFQYRALRFGRNDKTALYGFEQDDFVPESNANKRSRESIVEEFNAVRDSTITLFKSFGTAQLKRIGTASNTPMSVAALGFVIGGHQKHHLNVLVERYF